MNKFIYIYTHIIIYILYLNVQEKKEDNQGKSKIDKKESKLCTTKSKIKVNRQKGKRFSKTEMCLKKRQEQ